MRTRRHLCSGIAATIGALALLSAGPVRERGQAVIVQAGSADLAVAAVTSVGGRVTHELGIIDSVGAVLTQPQLERMERKAPGTRVYAGLPTVETAGKGKGKGKGNSKDTAGASGKNDKQIEKKGLDTVYPTLIEADKLHRAGIDGHGVTIAFVDTGVWAVENQIESGIADNAEGQLRILATYNAIEDDSADGSLAGLLATLAGLGRDGSGHGTHVTSVAMSSYQAKLKGNNRTVNGIAPNADLVVVKAFDENGSGTYLDVIRGLDWVVANRDRYGIRVLNLSFSAEPRSHYWDDPLNQAVMAAWRAGIVVVASAGNRGPEAMTIGVPGNVPYVITVGAMSDAVSNSPSDDFLASFSSAGPTFEGFVKPEVLAPGGHIMGLMPSDSRIATDHPEYHDGASYFTMSGTSQATAIVSGTAALMLQADPALTPEDVKCRLMYAAAPAVESDPVTGELVLAYSVFQQGAGLVNARRSVYTMATGCANRGLDIGLDLAGVQHFGGLANLDPATGSYYLMGLEGDGFAWSDSFAWSDGFKFHSGYLRPDGFAWSDSFVWNDGYMWSDSFVWSDSFAWSDAAGRTVSINTWVEQE